MLKKTFRILCVVMAFALVCSNAMATPLIGDSAPSFKADTTNGKINFPSDYQGKWVILFSHPGDFTPVCTTEFMAFEKSIEKFNALNTQLIGLSEDNVDAHRKWLDSIKMLDFNGSCETRPSFPIIDDKEGNVAKKYGMLQKDKAENKTVRAVFVIDPEAKVRAVIYYPQSTGRYIPEIQRLLIALQTSDKLGVATPANWLPGDDVIVPTANVPEGKTATELEELGITKYSPYLYTKKLDKDEICDNLFE